MTTTKKTFNENLRIFIDMMQNEKKLIKL